MGFPRFEFGDVHGVNQVILALSDFRLTRLILKCRHCRRGTPLCMQVSSARARSWLPSMGVASNARANPFPFAMSHWAASKLTFWIFRLTPGDSAEMGVVLFCLGQSHRGDRVGLLRVRPLNHRAERGYLCLQRTEQGFWKLNNSWVSHPFSEGGCFCLYR